MFTYCVIYQVIKNVLETRKHLENSKKTCMFETDKLTITH